MNKKISGFWGTLPTMITSLVVFLIPLFFVSNRFIDFLSAKVGLFAIGMALVMFVWSINALKKNKFRIPTNFISLSILLIPLTYFISAFFSGNIRVALLGKDFGYDNVMIFSALFVFLYFIIFNFQDKKKAKALQVTILSSVAILLILNTARVSLASFFPELGFFSDYSTNTIGQWYDVGIIAGLGAILSIVALELFKPSKKMRLTLVGLLFLSLLNLFVVGFQAAWIILGVFSIIIFVYVFSLRKSDSKEASLPVTSLITFLISFVFLIAGSQLSAFANQLLDISFVEVRPSFSATNEVLMESLKQKPLFGFGPTNFDQAWIQNKPNNFNLTELWNVNFRYGYNFVSSFVVMGGIFHALAWVLFLGFFLFYGFKSMFMKSKDEVSRFILISSFISSLYMWIVGFVYVPSFPNMVITFALTGIFVASLYREKIIKSAEIDITKNSKYGFVYVLSLVILLLVTTTSIWHFSTRVLSEVNYRQGQVELALGNINQAEVKIYNSLVFYPTDLKIQQLTRVGLSNLGTIINNDNLSDEDRLASFRSVLSSIISNIGLAVSYDPVNTDNYILLGNLFEDLISYNIEGAYDEAKAAYEKARELNQKDPSIVLALARLEVSNENYDIARELITQSLELKENYSEAVFLLSQIEVIEGNIDQAIRTVETAAQVRPNDPIVFFQLGLLRYQDERFGGAVTAFESAVALSNSYDNAIYFLGLSYDRVGREDEAIMAFELLNRKYPNDAGMKSILDNLKSGDNPFVNNESQESDIEELPIDEVIE